MSYSGISVPVSTMIWWRLPTSTPTLYLPLTHSSQFASKRALTAGAARDALCGGIRLLVGEGWNGVMNFTQASTSYNATMFFFMSYTLIATILFSQLFLGIFISLYNNMEVPQLQPALRPQIIALARSQPTVPPESICDRNSREREVSYL